MKQEYVDGLEHDFFILARDSAAKIERLEKEIERLREALKKIVLMYGDGWECTIIAETALQQKESE